MASMYRGVYLQNTRTIKFNARICNRYTRISLGSFKNAEEAALAYDRAAMKLHKDNASLNFPGLYTEEEVLFQRGKSEAEIIQMITNETYASELVSFVSRLNPHGRPAQVSNGSHQLLFYVNLINAEVGYQVLFLSKTLGLSHFPELAGLIPGEADSIRRTKIHFYDRQKFRSWTFEFCYLKNIETFVVTEDWGDFAEVSNLQEGDTVLFYRYHHAEGNNNRTLYMVDFLQRQPTVMLFGVQIS